MAETIQQVVAKFSELKEGELKEVEIAEGKVLIVRSHDKVYACSHKCTHYGAPLKSGAFCNGRVRCPWHGACFSVKTGDIEDFPGLDALRTFPVTLNGDDVVVTVKKSELENPRRVEEIPEIEIKGGDDKRIIIVGGGPAGAVCAQTLRKEGFDGPIVLISKEKHLPYDRPKLSKALSTSVDKILLRPLEFYQKHKIDVLLGKEVVELDPIAKTVKLSDNTTLSYWNALVASGATPRTIPAPGADLKNIFVLREPSDAALINDNCDGKRVVIVGSSFIGMEVASCIAKRAKSVVVVGMESVPFERVLGEKIGLALQRFHEKSGITFRMKRVVKEFRGDEGKIRGVLLDNGEVLDADTCILGAGVIPATQFIKEGVKKERDQSIVADKFLKAADNLYVAGDICRYPYHLTGEMIRVEHWGMAEYQGRVAALNMLGKGVEAKSIPYFWTTQYGKGIRYCGHALSYDDLYIDGNVDKLEFVAYYIRQGQVIAAASIARDPIVSVVAELLDAGKMPDANTLKSTYSDSNQLIKLAASI